MIPGPNRMYKCPECGHLLKKGSIISGNTFGAELYSDGKSIATMLPEFPDLTKCKKCDAIFWLSTLKEIEISQWDDGNRSHWINADNAEFLSIEEYNKVLDNGLAESKEEELFIRQQIWWAYNDRKRADKPLFTDENDEIKYGNNCHKLIALLDQNDLNQKIMIAEIKRNLGDFESCVDIIKNIDDNELNWLKEKFISECEQKNRWVIKLN
jgi:hypothetical protein